MYAIHQRVINQEVFGALADKKLTPLQKKIIATRVSNPQTVDAVIDCSLSVIPHYQLLKDHDVAAKRIAKAIINQEIIGCLTDYDCDGLSANTVLQHALLGYFNHPATKLVNIIGHRMRDGYGVNATLINKILTQIPLANRPGLIITADCGSSDQERIATLKENGIDVIVTDHHAIPVEGIPHAAIAVINPSRDDCTYPDNTIAGVMVAWLTMCAVRDELIRKNHLPANSPKLSGLLDFVAIGTVADAVSIASPVNRAVVKAGLQLMNKLSRPCWQAFYQQLTKTDPINEGDLGFQLGPRINARSRMQDPYVASYFLMATTMEKANAYIQQLNDDNQLRKTTEADMLLAAKSQLADLLANSTSTYTLVVYDDSFHAGVQGIVASRLLELSGKPTFVFSPTDDPAKLSGSGRTIESIHLRNGLQFIADKDPSIFYAMGGHKGACGCKIHADKLSVFTALFDEYVCNELQGQHPTPTLIGDGSLTELTPLSLQVLAELDAIGPYGREFEYPLFQDAFLLKELKFVGKERKVHASVVLTTSNGDSIRGIWFNAIDEESSASPIAVGETYKVDYVPMKNVFNNQSSLQLMIKQMRG